MFLILITEFLDSYIKISDLAFKIFLSTKFFE